MTEFKSDLALWTMEASVNNDSSDMTTEANPACVSTISLPNVGSNQAPLPLFEQDPLDLAHSYLSTFSGKGYFACILDATTTYGRKMTKLPLTYLDRGQSYTLRMKNVNSISAAQPVKLGTVFRVNLNTHTEAEEFANWPLNHPGLGPMLNIDNGQSVLSKDSPNAVLDITRHSTGNWLSLKWISRKTEAQVKLALKFNFLSANFAFDEANCPHGCVERPLTLTVDTFDDSLEGQSRRIDSASCKIIVLDPGQSRQHIFADYERYCLKEKGDGSSSSAPMDTHLPSYSSTSLQTCAKFLVKRILFVSIDKQNDYHPLFLHHFDVSHFRESLDAFLSKWLPSNGSNEQPELFGNILVIGLPGQNATCNQVGTILTTELIATKMKDKSIYECVLFKDKQAKDGETGVKLIFQGDYL